MHVRIELLMVRWVTAFSSVASNATVVTGESTQMCTMVLGCRVRGLIETGIRFALCTD